VCVCVCGGVFTLLTVSILVGTTGAGGGGSGGVFTILTVSILVGTSAVLRLLGAGICMVWGCVCWAGLKD
jgi:hypothetical protein